MFKKNYFLTVLSVIFLCCIFSMYNSEIIQINPLTTTISKYNDFIETTLQQLNENNNIDNILTTTEKLSFKDLLSLKKKYQERPIIL